MFSFVLIIKVKHLFLFSMPYYICIVTFFHYKRSVCFVCFRQRVVDWWEEIDYWNRAEIIFYRSVSDKHCCLVKNQFIGRWGIGHYYYKFRDRDSSFEPQLIPKRQKDVSEIEEKGFDLLQSKPHTAMAMSWVY